MENPLEIGFRSVDGLECRGYLSLPEGTKAPCVVELPAGITPGTKQHYDPADNFFGRMDYFLNSRGIAIFHIDRRGSLGYGEEFLKKRDLGGLEVDDVLTGIRELAGAGLIDERRIGVYGTSSSAIPAIFALDRSDELAFGFFASGIFDLELQARYEETHRRNVMAIFKAMRVDKLDDFPYQERSPVLRELMVKCPVLLYHGRDDIIAPVEHSRMMFDKLKSNGCDVKYKEISDFPHLKSSSDPESPVGQRYWNTVIGFLKDKGIIY